MTTTKLTTTRTNYYYFRVLIALIAALALAASLLLTQAGKPAWAAFPGANGKIVFMRALSDGNFEIFSMNPDGSAQRNLTKDPAIDQVPAVSPDGKRIAFARTRDGNSDIYTMNSDGSGLKRLTKNPASDASPTFSPNGKKIAFDSDRDGAPIPNTSFRSVEIYIMNSDGSGLKRLTKNPAMDFSPTFSPDGSKIAFASGRDGVADPSKFLPDTEIYTMNPDGSAQTRLTKSPGNDSAPSFSPEGTRIAFESDRDGDFDIYVMTAGGSNQTPFTKNTLANDRDPAFSPDGRRITFQSTRDGDDDVYTMNASDGLGQANRTNLNSGLDIQPDWGAKGNAAPVVVPISPKPTSSTKDQTPTIRAKVSDKETELFRANIKLFLDGNAITTFTYDRVFDRITFTPRALKAGKHTVKVVATDALNKSTTKSWSFTVQK